MVAHQPRIRIDSWSARTESGAYFWPTKLLQSSIHSYVYPWADVVSHLQILFRYVKTPVMMRGSSQRDAFLSASVNWTVRKYLSRFDFLIKILRISSSNSSLRDKDSDQCTDQGQFYHRIQATASLVAFMLSFGFEISNHVTIQNRDVTKSIHSWSQLLVSFLVYVWLYVEARMMRQFQLNNSGGVQWLSRKHRAYGLVTLHSSKTLDTGM